MKNDLKLQNPFKHNTMTYLKSIIILMLALLSYPMSVVCCPLTVDKITIEIDNSNVKDLHNIINKIRSEANFGEVITVFLAMILWHVSPLASMHLLWINLVTDSLPAIALGMEAVEADVMSRKPKPKNEGIFAHGFGIRVVVQGIMFALLTLVGYVVGTGLSVGDIFSGALANNEAARMGGSTLAFMVLALCQVVQSFNMRSEHSLFKIGFFGNKTLNLAAIASTAMVALVLFTPLNGIFELTLLSWEKYLIGLALIFVPLVVMELAKLVGFIKHREH